jgi:hypothetical protein
MAIRRMTISGQHPIDLASPLESIQLWCQRVSGMSVHNGMVMPGDVTNSCRNQGERVRHRNLHLCESVRERTQANQVVQAPIEMPESNVWAWRRNVHHCTPQPNDLHTKQVYRQAEPVGSPCRTIGKKRGVRFTTDRTRFAPPTVQMAVLQTE